jgi:hypothetical protein
MTVYINKDTNEYPRYQGDIRLVHPEIGEEFICPPCFVEVLQTEPPIYDATKETLIEDFPELIDGTYVQKWRIQPLDELTIFKIQTRPKDPLKRYEFDEVNRQWIMTESFYPDDVVDEQTDTVQVDE